MPLVTSLQEKHLDDVTEMFVRGCILERKQNIEQPELFWFLRGIRASRGLRGHLSMSTHPKICTSKENR